MPKKRQFEIRGALKSEIEIPEIGLKVCIDWTDGRSVKGYVIGQSPAQQQRAIRRAAGRVIDRTKKTA